MAGSNFNLMPFIYKTKTSFHSFVKIGTLLGSLAYSQFRAFCGTFGSQYITEYLGIE